ncbi:MAG: hypothetical protein HY316_11580 [Acidobacteria bacterium]|nr:hypothetical protein [Acidobacteriota bacterium]
MPAFWRNAKRHISFDGSSANLSLLTRTLGEGMYRRLGPGFIWAVFGARGHAYYEGLIALGEGEVDFAMITPPVVAQMALQGKGYFTKAYPNLRAVVVYPQNDWLGCAVRSDMEINSFEDIKAKQAPIRIATGPIGQNEAVGFLTERILEAYGISVKDIEGWGGKFMEARISGLAIQMLLDGEADMACHEAWKSFYQLVGKIPVKFLPVSEEVLNQLQQQFGFQRTVIRRGLYGQNIPDRDIPVVDFSDWVLITSTQLPDDLGYLTAQVAVEDRQEAEAFYTSVPERDRGMDLPLRPEIMWKNVGIPLHPGAEKYYREKGYMK